MNGSFAQKYATGFFGSRLASQAGDLAASLLPHGLVVAGLVTVVTRDTGDYKLARVALLNPWVDESS